MAQKFVVLAVFDSAAQAYMRPIFAPAVGTVVREFSDELNRKDAGNEMSKHPDDYVLYQLGHWDDQTGMFETATPAVICRGKDCVAPS